MISEMISFINEGNDSVKCIQIDVPEGLGNKFQ
jgi:hypothetical protein